MSELKSLLDSAEKAVKDADTAKDLADVRITYLGKKGKVTAILKTLGAMPAELRAKTGKEANIIKNTIDKLIENRRNTIEEKLLEKADIEGGLDITAPAPASPLGRLHPITRIRREVERIFLTMGFCVADGPHVEDDHHNFEALNIPQDHPARDSQDTFWLENGMLLRTHTSSVQARTLKKMSPPLRIIAPGRVFRYEATDASHDNTFYQIEGLMVDKDISVANMVYFMKKLLAEIFRSDVQIRLRPGYFPFVEPGFELDISCVICAGKGCSVCKRTGWLELLPCGLVHPNVLSCAGLDTDEWCGWAFGLGLDRLVMMKYGIDDIRHFHSGDVRFIERV